MSPQLQINNADNTRRDAGTRNGVSKRLIENSTFLLPLIDGQTERDAEKVWEQA
jgi:hypothetical protein